METDRHYLVVGSFVLLSVLAAVVFSVWLAGFEAKRDYTPYRIHFSESVSGLDVGGAVKLRGVRIGKVEKISIEPSNTELVRVDVSLLKTAPIKTDTVASLKLQGITGAVYVELTGSSQGAPDLVAAGGEGRDRIPEIPSKPGTIQALMDRLPEILAKISDIADRVNELVKRTNDTAGGQYQQLYETLNSLKKASSDMGALAKSLKENPSQVIAPPKEKGIPAP